MKEILDKELLQYYIRTYHIDALFDTPNLPFRLYEYEPGEMMNIAHPTKEYIKFVVKGEWNLYHASSSGRRYLIGSGSGFSFSGDTEFCGEPETNRWHEVRTTVHAVELPLTNLRETLLNDNRFLRFLLRQLMSKLSKTSQVRDGATSMEECLLYYLRYECPDHRITEVEQTAFRLNYSRRQLQRVLKELTEKNVLVKEGKGIYRLLDHA